MQFSSIKIRIEIRRFNFLGNLSHLEGKGVKLINPMAKSRSWNEPSCLASREGNGVLLLEFGGS